MNAWRLARKKGRRAFTLVEIMLVVMIISMLLSIATPNFVRAREKTRKDACIANLKRIQGAKEQWAMLNNASPTSRPRSRDLYGLNAFIKTRPRCPSGGTYTIGTMSETPWCTRWLDGHLLP
jgi:prepilin-type N-terminal cleavage/methylation domain-containing protein